MQKGFIKLFVTLAVFAAAGYASYTYLTRPNLTPQENIVEAAQSIPRHSDASTWQTKYLSDICIIKNEPCTQSAQITFSSQKSWNEIYFYYRGNMPTFGWQTNSTILTSVPTSIVFLNTQNCETVLSEKASYIPIKETPQSQFQFKISCKKEPQELKVE